MFRCTLFILLILLPHAAHAQVWELVWSDEFETEGLPDPARWSYDVGGDGWGNQELQYYTENRTENARIEGGVLIIEAHKEPFKGNQYTSARLVSRGKGDWAYGRIEVRAKLPSGRGTWPAIWMLPTDWIYGDGGWPDNGEIDIMEHVGHDPGRIHGTVHTHAYNQILGTQKGSSIPISTATEAFHVYAIEWTPLQIDFSVDDTIFFRYFNEGTGWTTWPFDHPFHLLLNLAIGGTWGGAEGVDDTIFPTRLEVDYVRVYANTALPEVTFTPPPAPEPGGTLALEAEASIIQGEIAEVAFLQGDGVLGIDTEAPYAWTVANAQAGCYRLAVRATDALGWSTTSPASDLIIGEGCPQAPYLIAPHPVPGRIEAEYFDLGGPGVGYLDLDAQNLGGAMRTDEGVDLDDTADEGGGHHVTGTTSREWLQYTVDVQTSGTYALEARVASATEGGAFSVEVDGVDVTGEVAVPATGGDQSWQTVTTGGITLDAGLHVVRFRIENGGFNLNYFSFTPESATPVEREEKPGGFALEDNFPEPFSSTTRIAFSLSRATFATLTVFNVHGRRVATLIDGRQAAGRQVALFDASALPSGLYFYRLATPSAQLVRPMMVLR